MAETGYKSVPHDAFVCHAAQIRAGLQQEADDSDGVKQLRCLIGATDFVAAHALFY
jgi:hypothetical protein